jgi:hypothetical protein
MNEVMIKGDTDIDIVNIDQSTATSGITIGIIVGFVLGLLTWTHCPWG